MQAQLNSISKRSPSRQAIVPPGVIEGNEIRCWTANCSSPKRVTTQPRTQKYSHGRGLIYPISIPPTGITNWMKDISKVSSLMLNLATIRFGKAENGSPKRVMLNSTTQECTRKRRLTFPSVNLTSRNHYVTQIHFLGAADPQASPYSILHSSLQLTKRNHAESDDTKIIART